MRKFDVIISGTGISGLATAVTAAEKGLSVCILTKEDSIEESNTFYAQGGIVASGIEDSPELLEADIISAGSKYNNIEAVKFLAEKGPAAVEELLINKAGVPFIRDEDGALDRTREAAHSVRRILHVKDATGKAIERSMLSYAQKHKNIIFLQDHIAVDIITNSHNSNDIQEKYRTTRAMGFYVFNKKKKTVLPFFADAVVLATGGVGNLYLHTTNPKGATGDGLAMAFRAGAELINCEFIQFHPTKLFHRDLKRFLITEALRGEGARLMNTRGEYFMEKYNRKYRDLAPRDEVARAIYMEMENLGAEYVLLDTSGIKVPVRDRFSSIYDKCIENGLDIENEPIPVVPAAHYFCGGIKVDIDGRTSIEGLYAVGETACTGVHGANRLASVSLLEGLLFGITAANRIKQDRKNLSEKLIRSIPEWVYPDEDLEDFDPVLISNDLLTIQMTMWNYVGVIRSKSRMLRAISDLNYMNHRIERFYKQAEISKEIVELRNAVISASVIAKAAYANSVSVGCHYLK